MEMFNIHEAKTKLSQLIEMVEGGQEIVIARAGRPMARLVPFVKTAAKRQGGAWRGQVRVADDFDDTPEGLIKSFEGEDT